MITVYAFALSALGMAGVYLGIAFLNGFLFPSVFGGLYAVSNDPKRIDFGGRYRGLHGAFSGSDTGRV